MFSDLRGQRQDRPSQPELVEQAEAPGAVIIASQRLQRPIIAKATLLQGTTVRCRWVLGRARAEERAGTFLGRLRPS